MCVAATALTILAQFKEATRQRFHRFMAEPMTTAITIPGNPKEAFFLGIMVGRGEGFGRGLEEGTQIGLDTAFETIDTLTAMGKPIPKGERPRIRAYA